MGLTTGLLRPLAGALVVFAATGAVGCGDDDDDRPGTLPEHHDVTADLAQRERCPDLSDQVQTRDVNLDQAPDIWHRFNGQTRVCSEFDLNFDGVVDSVAFYESDGETRRLEERDYDFDGRPDILLHYEGGEVVRQEIDSNYDNEVDTWIFCEHGVVARTLRDRARRGEPDTWETYDRGVISQAGYDDDHNGVPEKFEFFRAGRLVAFATDSNNDGEPDEREPISHEVAGPPDDIIYCDRAAAERVQQAVQEQVQELRDDVRHTREEALRAQGEVPPDEQDGAEGDDSAEDDDDHPWAGASDVQGTPAGHDDDADGESQGDEGEGE